MYIRQKNNRKAVLKNLRCEYKVHKQIKRCDQSMRPMLCAGSVQRILDRYASAVLDLAQHIHMDLGEAARLLAEPRRLGTWQGCCRYTNVQRSR